MSEQQTRISLIAAFGTNRAMGKDNGLPWGKLPRDMRRFRKLTFGHPVAMGRSTFESLSKKPLPKRLNIVLSRTLRQADLPTGLLVANSVPAVVAAMETAGETELFFIGGAQVFKEVMPLAHRMYLTLVHQDFPADTFFPEFDLADPAWISREVDTFPADADNLFAMTFITLDSRKMQ
ncbi:MAG: dihydrofolate reductase [bacterium]|nr:dihydrofolate reductase [bacterium]